MEPLVVEGSYAIAGWIQQGRGGRTLLQKGKGRWSIALWAGNGLKNAKVLQSTGMPAEIAGKLAANLAAADAKLRKEKLALIASFEGMVKVDASHDMATAHGH